MKMNSENIIQLLRNLKIEELEPTEFTIARFRMCDDFKIEVDGLTLFFDNSEIFNSETFIEIDNDGIAFRSRVEFVQTTYIAFDYDDVDDMGFDYDDKYHYFEKEC